MQARANKLKNDRANEASSAQIEKLVEAIKCLESKFGQVLEIQQLNNTDSKTIGISVSPPPSGQPSPIINSNIDKEINLSSVVNDI